MPRCYGPRCWEPCPGETGPLCTPADEIGHDIELPTLETGDVLAVLVSGAYGLTFSNTMFLSHPTAAEILVEDGQCSVTREAGKPEDALRGQLMPGEESR